MLLTRGCRIKKDARARKIVTTSNAPSMQFVARVLDVSLAHWERRFGSFSPGACQSFMRRLLRNTQSTMPLTYIIITLDNAPSHRRVKAGFGEEELCDADVLCLGLDSLV